jgi:RimJ/RimL family protein N-acetyltransferase
VFVRVQLWFDAVQIRPVTATVKLAMVDATFERLTTVRLALRRFRSADIQTFAAYRGDPEIARFQSWENFTPAHARAFIDWIGGQHPDTPGEWFQFAIELTATGAMIGDCALHAFVDKRDEVEVGFTLAQAHQGCGYATEAVGGLLDYAFGALAKACAIAITDVRNTASIAVLERLGFARDPTPREPVLFKGEMCDEHLYRLERAQWLPEGGG